MGAPVRDLLAGALSAALLWAPFAAAAAEVDRLATALLVPEVVTILREEGLRHGRTLEADMLGGQGGRAFSETVAALYDTDAMEAVLRDALGAGLDAEQMAESLAFFDTELGQRILRLEVTARAAMADAAVEGAAEEAFGEARDAGDARVDAVERFIAINDLGERNVAGALGSNYQFFLGLVDGGGAEMSEGEILDEVWGQEETIRTDTADWLRAFLFMAYSPLAEDEMERYLAYSASPSGAALNAALFEGFERMYRDIYYGLGRATARALDGADL